jgi:hypothetical protein
MAESVVDPADITAVKAPGRPVRPIDPGDENEQLSSPLIENPGLGIAKPPISPPMSGRSFRLDPEAGDAATDLTSVVRSDTTSISISPPQSQLAAAGQNFTPDSVPQITSSLSTLPATVLAETGRAVAMRISRAIRSGEETLTIDLHPAELGHLAVRLAFHDSGVDVRMVISRQETFDAFTKDRASLEQQFASAGIDLGAGGLDLKFGQQPAPQPSNSSTTGEATVPAEPVAAETHDHVLGTGMINIVA